MSKKMFSRERERGKLRFSALLILIGLLLFGCDPTMVTITYNANGGKGEMKPQAVESGVEVKLNANTFTKDGSDFTGWNEAADGSGKAYADGATVAPTGNLTLYAQWQVKSTPEDPGTENPGTEDPGTEDPGTEDPGTEDPKPPVAKDNHITNLPLIYVVEEAYKSKNDNAEFGWTKTAEGYVDMTIAKNQELVAGVTSFGSDGDMFLNGIEYFTGLQELILKNNSVLTKLPDLTSFSNLQRLTVTFTTESTADSSLTAVSGLPVSLEELDLSENKLTALDVSKLANLKKLMVFNNELTELDITNNTQLTTLSCFNNRMTALDITKVEAFSQAPRPSTSILACGLQRNDSGRQDLTLTATQAQKTALASLFSEVTKDENDPLNVFRVTNDGVVWDVPGAELELTEGTAVFNATSGLKLPFTVVNAGALTEEELTQLLANATKTVTLFTTDDATGTPVETGISHGVDGSTPYILVAAAAFPPESTTYSKIEVELQAEGYETQTLTYTNVSVNPEQPGGGESDVDLQLTKGTAVFNAASGLKLSFTVDNPGSLTQDGLMQLLANATKTVTLFTADNETGTPVKTGISHGVEGSTPYISVEAEAFPQESTTYTQIKVVLEAEGYVTQTLIYTNVSVNVPKAELGLTKGTAVFNKTDGLTLSFSGSTLPENASASVSLNGTQVDSQFNSERNAVIVDLEALTNDTVGMTVTVTVSAAGYNDAVLRYEGVNTVWIPDGVTATFDNTEKIGSESVSVTISQTEGSDDLSGIKISSGTYSVDGVDGGTNLTIGADGRSFTAPILEGAAAKDTGTTVTISLVLTKENATDTVTVDDLTLTVYPETHVRFDGKFYALAQGFDFTDVSTLSGVTDGENAITEVSAEGYVFSISPTGGGGNEKKSLNFSLSDSENIVLTMIEAKWDRNNCANIFVAGLDERGRAAYGWSPFKGNYSFMLGVAASGADSGQRWNSKNDNVRLSVEPAENTFNKYFVFDNGEGNATLGFNDRVKLTTAAITSKADTTINRISSIGSNGAWPLTFQHANGTDKSNPVTYTLRAVNFYKAISQQ